MSNVADIAIVGASSLVGDMLINVLEEHSYPFGQVRLVDVDEEAGERRMINGQSVRVEALSSFDFASVKLAIVAGDRDFALQHIAAIRDAGALVIGELESVRVAQEANAAVLVMHAIVQQLPAPEVLRALTLVRGDAGRDPAARAERHNRNPLLSAERHDGADLVDRARPDHTVRRVLPDATCLLEQLVAWPHIGRIGDLRRDRGGNRVLAKLAYQTLDDRRLSLTHTALLPRIRKKTSPSHSTQPIEIPRGPQAAQPPSACRPYWLRGTKTLPSITPPPGAP